MRYIKLKNGQPVNYSIKQLLIDYPDAIIYEKSQMPSETLLSNYDVYPLITTPQPELNEDKIAEESIPIFQDGEWYQTWSVRLLSNEEIEKIINNAYVYYVNENDVDLPETTDNEETMFAEYSKHDSSL